MKLSKVVKTIIVNWSNMVKCFRVFGKPKSNIVSPEELPLEDWNESEDDDLPPEATDGLENGVNVYELPVYEKCVTHTLHAVSAVDTREAITKTIPIGKFTIQPLENAKHYVIYAQNLLRHVKLA